MSVNLTHLTHVVIRTGYAPYVFDIDEIEGALRQRSKSQLTCLYAYSPLHHLGVSVSSPTGFELEPKVVRPRYTGDLETYHTQVSDLCHQLLARKSDDPFYSDTLRHLDQQLVEALEPHPDPQVIINCHNELIGAALDWSLHPDEDTTSPMSYQDRVAETQQVITAIGGFDAAEGTFCIKLDPKNPAHPFSLKEMIVDSSLEYCSFLEMTNLRRVETDTMSILIIDYDSDSL